MKITQIDDSTLRKIITGLIVSNDFSKAITPVLKEKLNLINVPYAKKVARWCIDYFDKYGNRTPYKYIQDEYERRKRKLQEDEADLIEEFLARLSKDYERAGDFNASYEIDQAIKYLTKLNVEKLLDDAKDLLNKEEEQEAEQLLREFKPIAMREVSKGGYTALELLDMDIPKPKWLLYGFIPKGLVIIAGKSKVGKSTFALNCALSIRQGSKAFNTFEVRRGDILYLSLEDGQARLKERILDITGNDRRGLKWITFHHIWPKLSSGGLQNIDDWIKEHECHSPIIIIDVFEKVRTRRKNSNNANLYAEDYEAFSPLSDLVKKYDTSIMLLTHTTKGETKDVFDQILGSAGTQGPADTLIVISKQQGRSDEREVSIRGKDIPEQHLSFAINKFRWTFQGNVAEQQLSIERQTIKDLLEQENRPMTNEEIRDSLKDSGIKSINMLLSSLAADGEIERDGRGKYAKAGFRRERKVQTSPEV